MSAYSTDDYEFSFAERTMVICWSMVKTMECDSELQKIVKEWIDQIK